MIRTRQTRVLGCSIVIYSWRDWGWHLRQLWPWGCFDAWIDPGGTRGCRRFCFRLPCGMIYFERPLLEQPEAVDD